MNRTSFYVLVGLTLSVFLLTSCDQNRKSKDGRTDTYSSGAAKFASDDSFSPIINEEKDIFEGTYPKAHLTPIYTNELDAINMLREGKVCLTIATRAFNKEETDYFKGKGYNAKAIAIAYDGLAFIVNKNNTDSCITVNDIKRILTGEAKNWSDIYPGSKRGEIKVVFDNPKSSTVHFCVDSLLNGKPINSPNIVAGKTSKEVIDFIHETPNAIGIIGSNWLNDKRDTTNTTFMKNITVMSVSRMDKATPENSWKPYQGYLYNDRYPIKRTIYALLNDPRRGLPWGFANFLQSYKGQLVFFKSAILPAIGDLRVRPVNISSQ
ncbi:MAG: substrate-binding domain-containing protein [Prevotella sp.]|nr:substrate-binding domain-containing protein [Prevotella sp.]MCR5151900.1 substrate-binding domain-containing protein [Prevotella sp.]